MNYSYVTVISNDKFYPGLCALAYSLMRVRAQYPLTVVIPENMDDKTKELIRTLETQVVEVAPIDLSNVPLTDNIQQRWNATFFKLSIFGLTQFDKIVFLDADMIVLQNIDELFEKPHMASVNAGYCAHKDWTRLNSGLMVIVPNKEEYHKMVSAMPTVCQERRQRGEGFGDQDVVNFCYPDWFSQKELVLSEIYNAMSTVIRAFDTTYGYKNMKVLHFAEGQKPWQYSRKQAYRHILSCFLHRSFLRMRLFVHYLIYLQKSCPNFRSF